MDLVYGLVGLAIIIFVIAAIFTVVREITLWYFRLGEMADNLKVIANHYRMLAVKPPEYDRQLDNAGAGAQPAPLQRPRFDPMTGQPFLPPPA